MKYVASLEDGNFDIQIEKTDEVIVNGEGHLATIENIGELSLYSLILDNASYEVRVEEREGSYRVLLRGESCTVRVEDERTRRAAKERPKRSLEEGEIAIRSPIPGLIFDVPVSAGQKVHAGEIVAIVEAMKMENELRSPRDGIVKAAHVTPGDSVDKGQVLVTIA